MKHKMTGNRKAMRRAFSFLLATVLVMSVLAGCGHAEPMTEAPPETAEDLAQDALLAGAGSTAEAAAIGATAGGSEHAAETEPDPNIDYTTGTPWLCSFLDGNVTADTPAPDLKDDFFLAVNKDDLASLQIPEGYSVCGTMYDVDMLADNDIKELFTDDSETDNDDAQLALNLYSLYMDWDTRNEIGVTPLKEEVDEVEAIDSIDALTEYLGRTPFEDQIGALYSVGTMSDLDDSAVHVLYVSQGSVLLDDPAEYRELTAYGAAIKEARTKLADRMLQKLGYSEEEAAGKIENCLAFETELAEAMMTSETRRSAGRPAGPCHAGGGHGLSAGGCLYFVPAGVARETERTLYGGEPCEDQGFHDRQGGDLFGGFAGQGMLRVVRGVQQRDQRVKRHASG